MKTGEAIAKPSCFAGKAGFHPHFSGICLPSADRWSGCPRSLAFYNYLQFLKYAYGKPPHGGSGWRRWVALNHFVVSTVKINAGGNPRLPAVGRQVQLSRRDSNPDIS